AYDRYYVLADKTELTIGCNLTLWTLVGKSEDGLVVDGQSKNGLAALTGLSDRTVERSLARLEWLGFLAPPGAGRWGVFPPDSRRLACFREKPPAKATDDIEAIKARHRAAVTDMVEKFDFSRRVEAINEALERAGLLPMDRWQNEWVTRMEKEAFSPNN